MTRARILLAILLAVGTTTNLRAQNQTAEALIALARGDYNSAAMILQPLAESDGSGDAAASFMMATLYESGRGVALDLLRACALYHRASGDDNSPVGATTQRLMRAMFHARGGEFFRECQVLANLGFDHRFEPATFQLGTGHSIAWALKGVTIEYQRRTTEVPMHFGPRGAAYLPLQHTVLRTGHPVPMDRHFIELLVWRPGERDGWMLHWQLFEVIRDQLISVAGHSDVLTRSSRPSTSEASAEADGLTKLRVNTAGLAEWTIRARDGTRTGTIPSGR